MSDKMTVSVAGFGFCVLFYTIYDTVQHNTTVMCLPKYLGQKSRKIAEKIYMEFCSSLKCAFSNI